MENGIDSEIVFRDEETEREESAPFFFMNFSSHPLMITSISQVVIGVGGKIHEIDRMSTRGPAGIGEGEL